MKTLRDVLPSEYREFVLISKNPPRAESMLDQPVVFEHFGLLNPEPEKVKPWPGTHRHVHCWWELANGYGVGWNENPSIGHSFPVVKLRKS
jgi:hypothetical protein